MNDTSNADSKADVLRLAGRRFCVAGIANKKSVGFHVGRSLVEAGATVDWVVRSEARRDQLAPKLPGDGEIFVCDVECEEEVAALGEQLRARKIRCTAWFTRSRLRTTQAATSRFSRPPSRTSCKRSTSRAIR